MWHPWLSSENVGSVSLAPVSLYKSMVPGCVFLQSSLEPQLVSKLCCFQFMELLYTRLPSGALSSPESKINKAYCKGNPKTGKEMTQAVTK